MSQNDTSYFHIGSTLYLRTNPKYYNVGGYASGTDIVINLRLFVFDFLHFVVLEKTGK